MSLNSLRYLLFKKSSIKASFKLEVLPPTEAASAQDALRTHLQIQQWLGNTKEPKKWGWKPTTTGLQPVYTTDDLVPQNLLQYISCRCTTGCNTMNCSCKKYGLRYSDICHNCHGQSCSNIEQILIETDSLEYMLNDDVNENGDCNDANGENNDEICSKRQRLC
ncbi:uncharacterized protein LOC107982104 [Nasonia vitripennis]|uniref:Tesmin/TSO1-like CXC domain-containing protein n=1 Tax=Nasonia vitripennis TaxID=7425 RepID=A0A7M7J4H4_NASVI|nr:uncharacterized protein LOC107982104 [Nasonia vitripennis]XP_016845059.1 uncharacterized protein LOC107982104 [Nasonia vitripennis]